MNSNATIRLALEHQRQLLKEVETTRALAQANGQRSRQPFSLAWLEPLIPHPARRPASRSNPGPTPCPTC